MRQLLSRFLRSILIGLANVIPGVSGGTMAVVLGLYEDITGALGRILDRKRWAEALRVLGPVAAGVLVGLAAFSKLTLWLLQMVPLVTLVFFAALVLGSVPYLVKLFQEARPTVGAWVALVLAAAAVVALALISPPERDSLQPWERRDALALLAFAGAGFVAAAAMVLPGLSGSFLLLVLGLYPTIIGAIPALDVSVLLPVAMGVLPGIWLTARGVSAALAHYPAQAYGGILGLVIGSLVPLLRPAFQPSAWNGTEAVLGELLWPVVAAAAATGLVAGWLLGKRDLPKRGS